jgi:hypothetical protein
MLRIPRVGGFGRAGLDSGRTTPYPVRPWILVDCPNPPSGQVWAALDSPCVDSAEAYRYPTGLTNLAYSIPIIQLATAIRIQH